MDIVLIRPDGTELESGPEEKQIAKGADKYQLTWGGRFKKEDLAHIEIPKERLFKKSFAADEALQWQKYLFHAKALGGPEELDGAWGTHSANALKTVIGDSERTPETWEALFRKFGPIEELKDFAGLPFIPPLT